MKDIARENIKNLTTLWKTVSVPFEGFYTKEAFHYTQIPNSDWPKKLWLKQQLDTGILTDVLQVVNASAGNLSFSYWDDFNSTNFQIIENSGFIKRSEQVGMSLKLKQKIIALNRLVFKRVGNEDEAEIWAGIYPKSFGYTISPEILNKTKAQVEFYIAYFEGNPIGTAMVLFSDTIIGIHGVGVIPEMRKKGFAEEIMQFLINSAIERSVEYATLQSSPMGKNIYMKMGFSEDFLMTNYMVPEV